MTAPESSTNINVVIFSPLSVSKMANQSTYNVAVDVLHQNEILSKVFGKFAPGNSNRTINLNVNLNANIKMPSNMTLAISTNAENPIVLQISFDMFAVDANIGAIYAGIILVFLNVLIVSEVKKHRNPSIC